jgi:hypothetical protein
MGIFVPTQTYLNYGKISQYLAADRISKNMIFQGSDKAPNLSWLIELVRKSIEWKNGIDGASDSINDTSLYLYDLCGRYIREAKVILNSGNTGTIINPSTGNQVTIATPFVQFRVGDVGAPMTVGQDTLTLNYAGIINPSIEITLDGTELPYADNNQISYTATYNPTNVQIVFNQAVQNSQLYMIHMVQLVNV